LVDIWRSCGQKSVGSLLLFHWIGHAHI